MSGQETVSPNRGDVLKSYAMGARVAAMVSLGFRLGLYEAMKDAGQDLDEAMMDASWFQPMERCVESYLEGDQRALDEIVLDLDGTPPFFRAAWKACRSIPAGETRSYAWLAAEAGSPLAVRAAGQAMARNPWPLIIPCHRVIASDGGLGGYGAGGLRVKAKLLQLEQAFNPAPQEYLADP